MYASRMPLKLGTLRSSSAPRTQWLIWPSWTSLFSYVTPKSLSSAIWRFSRDSRPNNTLLVTILIATFLLRYRITFAERHSREMRGPNSAPARQGGAWDEGPVFALPGKSYVLFSFT